MTLQKSSKVVLKWEGEWFWFLRAPTALHVPILTGTISALEPLGDDAASSDTETIGGISDVSIGGGPISEAEPVPVVEEVSMGPALRDALRWYPTKLAWTWRWSMILACASARAFAQPLLENRAAQGFDGPTPTTAEVIGDSRHAGFA